LRTSEPQRRTYPPGRGAKPAAQWAKARAKNPEVIMHVNVQDETDESGKPRVNVVIAFSGTWGIDKKMSKEELIQFEGLVIETCMGRHSEFR